MGFSVYQHWDPLKVCIVGRSYHPEFYSWIANPRTRNIFEKLAIETEEDFQSIIKKLQEFGVKIIRPDLPEQPFVNGQYIPPPTMPRDNTVMIGDTFYSNIEKYDFEYFYYNIQQPTWPNCKVFYELDNLPINIRNICLLEHEKYLKKINNTGYNKIFEYIESNGNNVETLADPHITGPMVSRIGRDLYFGTHYYNEDTTTLQKVVNKKFKNTRNHIVNTGGHSDGTYCPVCPGLIISLHDVPTYQDTFPGWEVVYLPPSNLNKLKTFKKLKNQNNGKWWLPGFETDQDVIDIVESSLSNWTGYVEETVFDVNMLIIDPKNVMVFNYNKQVFDALERYGITPHVVPFRHRYFWDGGVHCVTSDLHRDGIMQDYFPNIVSNRSNT
tara:strand:+ start:570 stop:1721 length:1152 start_codon:yes stop_codon:yes gene_type:complete